MVTIEELVIKATPEGISDVNEGLNSMEKNMDDTAESVEETSTNLDEAARGFKGAMGAVIGGLAVATTGLLSQVPIVGETVGSLGMILDTLVLKIDEDLRPALSSLSEDFREVDKDVREQEGALDAYQTAFEGVSSAIKDFVARGIKKKLKDIFGIDLSIETVKFLTVGGADPEKVAENIRKGILDTWDRLKQGSKREFNRIAEQLGSRWKRFTDDLQTKINKFTDKTIEEIKGLWPRSKKYLKRLKKKALKKLDELKEGAKQRGRDLVSGFSDGIRNEISSAVDAASDLAQQVRDRLPSSPAKRGPLSDLDETGPGMVDTFSNSVSNSFGRIDGGMVDGDPNTGASRALARTSNKTTISIDGREVERTTKSYRDNGTDLRGRYG